MNNQMGSAFPTEKLDRTNFTSWEYKMHQYLVGQGYLSYIKGAHENQPNSTHVDYPAVVKKTVPRWKPCTMCVNRPLHAGTPFLVK